MPDTAFLKADIAHRIGSLDLQVCFQLTSPWTVLFGPSGAGKSTILRILAGLTEPDSGTITLQNQLLLSTENKQSIPAGHRRIGFVTQKPTLFPHLNIRSNIGFGLHTLPQEQRDQRIDEMLRLFRIENFANRQPRELSGGEYQRAALARALAPEPKLLLLDEPFTGLDTVLKESILAELTAWLAERNLPALYVSHDLVEAYQTAAEVIVIENGKIEEQGPVQKVLAPRRQRLLQQLGCTNL